MPARTADLKRVLTATDAAWLVAGSMIGAGIFYVPGHVASSLPGLLRPLLAWSLGGLLALAGALIYAELGSRLPHAGGDYQYLSAAFGSLWGFLTGWAALLLTFSAAAALMAVVAADHLAAASVVLNRTPSTAPALVPPALVVLLTLGNVVGARFSGRATAVLKAAPLLGLVALFGLGMTAGRAELRAPWPEPAWRGAGELAAFAAAMVPIYFTYSGWNVAAYVAGELRQPRRDLLRGLVAGTLAVSVVYLAINTVVLLTVPQAELAGSNTACVQAARAWLGPRAEGWLALCVALVVLGSANVTLMAGARIYWAMARDGLLPSLLARTNAAGVPSLALWAGGAWTALLALFGEVGVLLEWSTLAILLLSSMAVAALFVLRRREPRAAGFRCPAFPLLAAAYLAVALAIAAGSAWREPMSSLYGVAIVAAGVPIWALLRRRASSLER